LPAQSKTVRQRPKHKTFRVVHVFRGYNTWRRGRGGTTRPKKIVGFPAVAAIYWETMNSDLELLQNYARNKSEESFAALVNRHLDLVYSAALRQVRSPQLAEEVAQSVFADLARNVSKLKTDTILTAWLYQVTRRTAIDAIRKESRRQARERIAVEMTNMNATAADWTPIEPLLDDAMGTLDETDRSAVLLRYFENKSLREVGQALGASEDAAQKRVSRAVERLREFLSKRGVAVGASGLVIVISANAVQAAPAGLMATISTAVLTGTAIHTSTAIAATKAIVMTTLQKILVTATLVVAGLATLLVIHHQARVKLLEENQSSRQQIAQLQADNESFSNRMAQANRSPSLSSERLRELLKLRGEVGVLRRQQREPQRDTAAAPPRTPDLLEQPAASGAPPSNQPAPFQVQLVLDEPDENSESMTNSAGDVALYVQKTPLMDYTAIRSASVERNASSGTPEINVEFSDVGKELFAAVTKENLNKRLAIVLDGHLYAAPVIRSEISGGKAQITGNFTEEEAQALAAKINDAIGSQ
jgi:RNA polymerase sigma factor (sigma-70 family)